MRCVILLIPLAALLAVACGGDSSSPPPSPTPSPSPVVVLPSPTPEPMPEPTPAIPAGWANCGLPLPTPGCEATVTNVSPQRLNVREDPGPDKPIIDALSQGDTVCLVGSPTFSENFRWWPVRTAEGTEGWMAAFDPDEPDKPWLTPAVRVCEGGQIAGIGTLSQEAPTEGTFLIDLAAEHWLRVLPSYSDSFVAVSPDGNTIVYHLAGELAAFDADSSDLHQLGEGRAAAFSPDGRVLALWGEQPQVTLIPWPDGEPVEVGIPGPVAGGAVWSGTTLAASTAEGIYFITADGTALRATDQAVRGFAWARHQSLLAFWTSDDQDGSILSTVEPGEEPQVLAQLPGERVQRASWSSDGSILAIRFSHPSPDFSYDLLDIRVIDVAGGHTRFTIIGAGTVAMEWSPVESLLLFDNLCYQGSQLMLVKGDGSNLRPLSEAGDGTPLGHAWSPDGREVATAVVERDAVTAVDVESGETRTLIRGPGLILEVKWVTPDRMLVTTLPGTGFCEDEAPQETRVVFP